MNKLIILSGPTCVGKTRLSIDIAKDLSASIISMDSMQIYKYLDIGTAKITKEEMQNINHFMISEVEPSINFSVKEFNTKAKYYIDILHKNNILPILVGGTGFYINALLYDNDFPEEDEQKKQEIILSLEKLDNEKGIDYLYQKLKEVDEVSFNTININNKKRIIRALTFYYLHNKTISSYNEMCKQKESKYNFLHIFLNDNRDALYDRINKRVDTMISEGLLFEIKNIINSNITLSTNAKSAIGYKELYDYVLNNINNITEENNNNLYKDETLLQLIEKIKQHSRNLAKRQITWFKHRKDVIEINISDYNYDFNKIKNKIIDLYNLI